MVKFNIHYWNALVFILGALIITVINFFTDIEFKCPDYIVTLIVLLFISIYYFESAFGKIINKLD